MDKLIQYLNEYERSKGTNLEITKWECVYGNLSYFGYGNGYSEFLCISKRYEFIKWLVEKDKIDLKKLDEAERRPMYVTDDMFSLYKVDECVIMLLSISDNPISDLISYLK